MAQRSEDGLSCHANVMSNHTRRTAKLRVEKVCWRRLNDGARGFLKVSWLPGTLTPSVVIRHVLQYCQVMLEPVQVSISSPIPPGNPKV